MKFKLKLTNESTQVIDEAEMSGKFGVISVGGSIGSKSDTKLGGSIWMVYDTTEEAKDKAKRLRSLLTPGEKSYYKMTFRVKELTVDQLAKFDALNANKTESE